MSQYSSVADVALIVYKSQTNGITTELQGVYSGQLLGTPLQTRLSDMRMHVAGFYSARQNTC